MNRTARMLMTAGVFAILLWGCGPIYDIRYEYEKPPSADRLCFSQCITGRSHCRQLGRLADANRGRDHSLCIALASGEKDKDRRAQRVAECHRALPAPVYHQGTECERDYNDCFIACGGTVLEVRECVANCDQE